MIPRKRYHQYLSADEKPVRSADLTGGAKTIGNGAMRRTMPLNGILWRMAQGVVHERVVRVEKKRSASRLSDDQVRDIRKRFNGRKEVTKSLAEEHGISETYAESIGRGLTHKFVI